jgi:arylsulfatase A-like enzyme
VQPRSLILITVDCLRADHVGFLGYNRPTTPFLDCLAGESFVFENAITAGAPTYYAIPPLLASRYPLALGRDVLGIAPEESTIASVLQESGFRTAALSAGNPYVCARFGYDRGFEVFRDFLQGTQALGQEVNTTIGFRSRANRFIANACHSVGVLGAVYDELYFQYCQKIAAPPDASLESARRFPSADVLVDQAIGWLKENSEQRFFLWLHLMDAHGPYFPKSEALRMIGAEDIDAPEAVYLNSYWNRSDLSPERLRVKRDAVVSLYDAGIRWVDEQIRRLAEKLVELNIWDRCALAVTADHGEEFLDHGGRYHLPRKLTEELVHVPLMVRVPGAAGAHEVRSPFSLLDLAPTLLDVVGIPSPADFRGRSGWSQLRKGQSQERAVVSECIYECTNPFYPRDRVGPRLLSVRLNQYKLVLDFSAGSGDLYDLSRDPAEKNPLSLGDADDVRNKLSKLARKHLVESSQSRDFDKRIASQIREFRLELARSVSQNREN